MRISDCSSDVCSSDLSCTTGASGVGLIWSIRSKRIAGLGSGLDIIAAATPSLCSARRSSTKLDRSGPASSSLSTCASHILAASAGVIGCKLQCLGRVLNGSPHRPEDVPLLGRQRTPDCQAIAPPFPPAPPPHPPHTSLVWPQKLPGAYLHLT